MRDGAAPKPFAAAIRGTFGALKRIADAGALERAVLPVPGHGTLLPICDYHAGDRDLIALLAEWRERNSFAFPVQFRVTPEGTALWLKKNLLDVDDRILFLVRGLDGRPVGHMGYANCLDGASVMEIDNVVRGAKSVQPGLMGHGLNALLRWAVDAFEPGTICLRVLNDNEHAISFYRKLRFVDDRLLPLRRRVVGGFSALSALEPGDSGAPDHYYLRMVWRP